jgi:hypothetical protein
MKMTKPVVIDGVEVDDYFIDLEGNIWSKKGKTPKKLSPCYNKKTVYPVVNLSFNGKTKLHRVHRLVCSAWHELPTPNGISKKVWKKTPIEIKELLKLLYQVNHIDHDKHNFHPSNLEWVTAKENQKAYRMYSKNSALL